jgi:hypothetical protein
MRDDIYQDLQFEDKNKITEKPGGFPGQRVPALV